MKPDSVPRPFADRLRHRLRRELGWLRARLVGHALLMAVGGLGMVLAVATLTHDRWSAWGPAGAWVVIGVAGALALLVLVGDLWLPLRRVAGLRSFSREVERQAGFDNLLEAATQFATASDDPAQRGGASRELVGEILRRATAAAEQARLAPRIPLPGVLGYALTSLAVVLVWLALGTVAPDRVAATWHDLRHPSSLRADPPTTGLYAVSGDLRVPVGDPVELVARDFTAGDEAVVLEVDRTGGLWQALPTATRSSGLDPSPWREIVVQLRSVEDPFRYRFRKGELKSRVHEVAMRERPVLTALRVRIEPPAYAGREVQDLREPGGTLTVLEGSRITIEGEASHPLASAARLVEGRAPIPMETDGARFTTDFVATEDVDFRLDLVDHEGLASEAGTLYRLVVEADEPPTVRILAPASDGAIGRDLRLAIEGLAADDVDLERVELVYRNELETEWTRRLLWSAGGAEVDTFEIGGLRTDRGEHDVGLSFTWDVGELSLLPGDALVYALEATDNDALAGGQVGRSRTYRLRLPTIAEVFDTEREGRDEDRSRLSDMLREGEELEKDLERLDRELKKDPDLDWSRKKEIEETLQRQRELRERLQESADEMRQRLEDFERNNAGSLEMAEKMQTIQELIEELKDDEGLQAYLDAMREAMEQLRPQDLQRNMNDALQDQEEFNRRLDRTIALLEQLEREREMSDMVEELNEYLQRQRQLAEMTQPQPPLPAEGETTPPPVESSEGDEDAPSEEPGDDAEGSPPQETPGDQESGPRTPGDEELARMQEQLREETEALQEKLEESLERLREKQEEGDAQNPSAQEMREALEEALEKMKEQQPSEPMDSAQEELSEGDRSGAREEQEEAMRRLLALYEVMLRGQQAMQQAQGKWAGEHLQQLAFDLLELSFREEALVDALREGVRGQQMRPLTREQGRVHRAVEALVVRLEELASQDFNISERLLSSLRELGELAGDAVDELELGRARRSRDTAADVMGNMNRVVIGLLTAAKSAQGGGGQGQPMPSLSQQMQQMGQEQSRLNGMTQDLRERMKQGMGEEERRQLAELEARQQAIRQQLERLREQLDDERRVLGDLGELERSMERVEGDLGEGRLDEDVQRQQEHILSRLLDAQRSVRERDFAKRRESRGAEELYRRQEGDPVAGELTEREEALRRWTAPDRAPRAYRDEVRQYFRRVQRELEGSRTVPDRERNR